MQRVAIAKLEKIRKGIRQGSLPRRPSSFETHLQKVRGGATRKSKSKAKAKRRFTFQRRQKKRRLDLLLAKARRKARSASSPKLRKEWRTYLRRMSSLKRMK